MTDKPISRRRVIASVGALSVTGFLAACATTDAEPAAVAPAETPSPTPEESPVEQSTAAIFDVAEIPVGGAVILSEEKVVLTQPISGEVNAFSVTCTHQGCPVSQVSDQGIVCACHNSVFSTQDGSVISGPATRALSPVDISITDGQVFRS